MFFAYCEICMIILAFYYLKNRNVILECMYNLTHFESDTYSDGQRMRSDGELH